MATPPTASPARRTAAWSLIALLLCQPGTGLAQVVAAGSGPYRPTVQTAANGVPLVQITAPSGAGVSRNQYQQFDVGSPGLVLNNSQVLTQTQQAGWIAGNPNLAGGSARLIVNEVTSSLPSRLAGYTEVAGTRAEVIIANPNGITCDGCGFINTSRGVLTTGTPVFGGDGSLAAFRVTGGRIDVQGTGLDAAGVDQFDLIARSVSVNAGLWAKRLNVVAGANRVDYASLGAQAIAGQGAAPPVAIDVALLGGMYADKIRLVGTEAGVGVAIAGNLAARMEDLELSSAGRLTLSGTAAAARHLSLSGTDLALAGANLAAGGDATLTATNGGIDHRGALTSAAGRLAIDAAGALDNLDGGLLGGDVDIVAAGLDNRRGSILQAGGSGSTITLASALDNRGGWIGADSRLTLGAQGIDNSDGRIANTGTGDTRLAAGAGALTNANGGGALGMGTVSAGGRLFATAGQIANTQAGTFLAAGDAEIAATAGTLDNTGGRIETAGRLRLATAQSFTHRAGDTLRGDGGIRIDSGDGLLVAAGASLESLGALELAAVGTLENRGSLTAGAGISLQAGALVNTGSIAAHSDVSAAVSGAADNSGAVSAQGALSLAAARFGNAAAGHLAAGTDLTLATTGDLVNLGTLSADNLILTAANLDNQGALAAMTDLTANVSGRLANRSGRLIYTGRDQFLYVNELVNEEDAAVWAGGNIVIQKNAAGDRAASVTNRIGLIEAQGDLAIRADTLTNEGSTPAVSSRSVGDSVPHAITACPGPGPAPGAVNGGCIAVSHQVQIGVDGNGDPVFQTVYDTNGLGEIIYNSAWGFRTATPGEVSAYFSRNPNAPRVVGGTDLTLVPTNPSGDAHEREGGWEVAAAGTEQYLAPGTVVKTARLLAGRDFVFAGGDIANRVGQIAATRDVSLTGASLVNQGLELQRVVTYTAAGYTLSAGRHMPWGPIYTSTITETLESVPASITAGGVLAGNLTAGLVNDAQARPALNARSAGNDVAAAAALPATPIASLQQAAGIGGAPAGLAGGAQLVAGLVETGHVTLPTGATGLFTAAPPNAGYLIEANPLFADRGSFLSSSYFLQSLGLDPAATEKRLGDGCYEQALVRDEVFALTGRRFLSDSSSAEAQFRALMDAGVATAARLHLTVGIDLTPAQVAALTADMVWLVEREVAGERVLVPQVYLSRAHAQDLAPSGALISGTDIDLVAPDLANMGRISARDSLRLAGLDITNRGIVETTATDGLTGLAASRDLLNEGGSISGGSVLLSAGRDLLNRAERFSVASPGITDTELGAAGRLLARDGASLQAGRDIAFAGGQLAAGGDASLSAGRHLDLGTATKETRFAMAFAGGSGSSSRTVEGGSLIDAGGALTLSAGENLSVTGSAARAASIEAVAGGDLTLAAAMDRESGDFRFAQGKGGSTFAYDRETVKGASLSATGEVRLVAGADRQADLKLHASSVTSDAGAITLTASRDVAIETAAERRSQASETWGSSSGFLSSRSSRTAEAKDTSIAVDSLVSGDTVSIVAGRDLAVRGSSVVGTGEVTLGAQGTLSLEAAENRQFSSHAHSESQSGLFSGGGMSITLGNRSLKQTDDGNRVWQSGSSVGSLTGNVNLLSGEAYRQTGSSVLAPLGDIAVTAPIVEIGAAYDTTWNRQSFEATQSGLTLAVSNPVVDAFRSARPVVEAMGQTKDPRMQALAAASLALTAKNTWDAISTKGELDPAKAASLNISLSLGSSSSQSESEDHSRRAVGSNLAAGNDLTIQATAGDLSVIGSRLSAGHDATLGATGNLRLEAAANESLSQSNSSGSSMSIGVGVSIGPKTGFYVSAGGSKSSGAANGSDVAWTPTEVVAGNTATLASGQDTTLKGATVSANQVVADIGGNLAIESLQDTSTYRSRSESFGASVSVPIGPGSFSVSANAGQTKIDSTYQSANTQSGITAGNGGFQINVAANTDLKGAVITGSDKAAADGNNLLVTGTLTSSDIENHASYSGQSVSLGVGYSPGGSGVGTDAQGKAATGAGQTPGTSLPSLNGFSGTFPVALSASGEASGTTKSAIGAGTVVIGDEAGQQAKTGKSTSDTLVSLNRDTKNANGAIAPIFHKNEIEAGFTIAQSFVQQVGTFLANRAAEVDAMKQQAKDKAEQANSAPGLSDTDRQKLRDEALALDRQADTLDKQWGAGGTYRQILTALSAAAGGNVAGSTGQFVRSMAINYIQQQGADYVGKLVLSGTITEGSPEHAALHAIVACAGAAASSQSCSAGAMGAAASSLLTGLFSEANPNETASEREARKNLITTLVTGLAAATGVNAATANNAATAATENNWLATQQAVQAKKELAACTNPLCTTATLAKWAGISTKQDLLTDLGLGQGLLASGWTDVKGIAQFLAHPGDGLKGIKEFIANPEVRKQVGEQTFAELNQKIDRIETALNQGGDENAVQLGKDLGGLLWQVGTVVTGAGSIAKGGVALAKLGVSVGTDALVLMARKMPQLITGTLADTAGTFRFTADQLPALTNIAKNDGKLGEQVAAQLMKDASGKEFVPIQNASGHGADLVYIDHNTKTVYHVEVKTNQVGASGGVPTGNLEEKFNGWINQAKNGEINGQSLPQGMKDVANDIATLRNEQGYTVSHNLMQIEIPRTGYPGQVTASIRPWPPLYPN